MRDEYVRYLIYRYMVSTPFNALVGAKWWSDEDRDSLFDNIIGAAFKNVDLAPNPEMYRQVMVQICDMLEKEGGVARDGDEYFGHHFRFNPTPKNTALTNRINSSPAHARVANLGESAFRRALSRIIDEDINKESIAEYSMRDNELGASVAPASDRIVRLTDNQSREYSEKIDDIISEIAKKNSLQEGDGIRELLLGQLKAGRELLRSGCFKIYAIQWTLIEGLKFLADRYEHEAVGALASTLLALLAHQQGWL